MALLNPQKNLYGIPIKWDLHYTEIVNHFQILEQIFQWPVLSSLLVSLLLNIILFCLALKTKSDKFTDFSYCLSFLVLTALPLFRAGVSWSQWFIAVAIALWALRLGSYLVVRIHWMKRDTRFDKHRKAPLRWLAFWVLQAVIAWLVMLPFTLYLGPSLHFGLSSKPSQLFIFILGLLGFTIGWLIEAISDQQKFRAKKIHPEHWVENGLWRFSRHPNYFGEILLWWSLFLAVAPALSPWQWLSALGPLSLTLALRFLSGIPILEKRAAERFGQNPDYLAYCERSNLLLPIKTK